jgi:hypothetical protein
MTEFEGSLRTDVPHQRARRYTFAPASLCGPEVVFSLPPFTFYPHVDLRLFFEDIQILKKDWKPLADILADFAQLGTISSVTCVQSRIESGQLNDSIEVWVILKKTVKDEKLGTVWQEIDEILERHKRSHAAL